jgi:uncharacterized spore protein YtfJ
MEAHPVSLPTEGRHGDAVSLVERIVRQVGLTSTAETVYGEPVHAHGHTVIPVARVYFAYGGGAGPELGGRLVDRAPDGRVAPALTSGGGAGGLGIARPAGYIEMSERGTRFVPVARDWRRPLVVAGALLGGLSVWLLRRA